MLRLLHDSHQHVVDDHHDDVVLNESLLTPKSFQLSLTAPRCPPYYTAQRCLMIGRRPRPDKHPYYLTRHQSNNNSQHNDSHSVRKTWDDFDPHHEYLMHRYIFQSTSNKGHHHKNRLLAMKRRQHSNGSDSNNSSDAIVVSPFHRNSSLVLADAFAAVTSHPHLPSLGPDLSSQVTRFLYAILPLPWQNFCRDSG
jgi:hypothetical protein